MLIREIKLDDYKKYLDLRNQVDSESEFMLYDPGERKLTYDQQKNIIQNYLFSLNSTIFVAELDGRLVGYLEVQGGTLKKIRHKIFIVVGILKEFTNNGIGTKLFEALNDWVPQRGIHRIELLYRDGNEIGRHLYEKMGFVEEARLKDVYFFDGRFFDEVRMCRIMS